MIRGTAFLSITVADLTNVHRREKRSSRRNKKFMQESADLSSTSVDLMIAYRTGTSLSADWHRREGCGMTLLKGLVNSSLELAFQRG